MIENIALHSFFHSAYSFIPIFGTYVKMGCQVTINMH